MNFKFDLWFNKQDRIVQVLLLIFPLVGWVVELCIRGSRAFRQQDPVSIVVFILFVVLGWSWILALIDLIYLGVKGHLILA